MTLLRHSYDIHSGAQLTRYLQIAGEPLEGQLDTSAVRSVNQEGDHVEDMFGFYESGTYFLAKACKTGLFVPVFMPEKHIEDAVAPTPSIIEPGTVAYEGLRMGFVLSRKNLDID